MPFIWIGFAVLMAFCEAFTVQLVSIWFVLGALSAALTTIFTPSIGIQTAVFLVVSFVALIVTRPLVNKFRKRQGKVNTNSDSLVGQIGVVVTEIKDTESVGQVKISGKVWSAKSEQAPIKPDERVKVLSIQGVKLIVEPAGE